MKMALKQLDLTSDNTPIHHSGPWRLYSPSLSGARTYKRSCVTISVQRPVSASQLVKWGYLCDMLFICMWDVSARRDKELLYFKYSMNVSRRVFVQSSIKRTICKKGSRGNRDAEEGNLSIVGGWRQLKRNHLSEENGESETCGNRGLIIVTSHFMVEKF